MKKYFLSAAAVLALALSLASFVQSSPAPARRANNFNTNSITSPVTGADAVTPTDNVTLTGGTCRGLYIGGAGDVAVILADDTVAVTFKAATAGTVLPLQARVVMSTNTTATNIVALY